MQIKFDGVKGYKTYSNAQKRGEEIAVAAKNWVGERYAHEVRWCVVALETGRFLPVFLIGASGRVNPGWFVHQVNIGVMN